MNAVVPVLLLLLLLGGRRTAAAAQQSGVAVPRQNTGGGGGSAWVRARFDVLRRIGVPRWARRAVVAHWARETGWGRFEWNNNPGNIRAIGWPGPRVWLTGRDGALDYRAYPSIDAGARDYWRLVSQTRRYAPALEHLRRGRPVEWYDALLRAGYSAHTPQAIDEFRRIYARLPDA